MDSSRASNAVGAPAANIEQATIKVAKGNIDNVVEVKGSVRSDPSIPVLSSAAGEVVKVFVDPKAAVAEGDPLFQVKTEVRQQPNAAQQSNDGKAGAEQASPSKPIYKYTSVLAPIAGTLDSFPVLLEQQVTVGQNVGSVSQQTLSIEGNLDSAQQYRLLSKPTTSTVTVNNGPAPFECPNVSIGAADLAGKSSGSGSSGSGGTGAASGSGSMGQQAGPGGSGGGTADDAVVSGKVTCKVPAGVPVFAGLGAKMSLVAGSVKKCCLFRSRR